MRTTLMTIHTAARRRVHDSEDRGATAAEYALMTSFIAVAILSAVLAVGSNISQVFAAAAGSI